MQKFPYKIFFFLSVLLLSFYPEKKLFDYVKQNKEMSEIAGNFAGQKGIEEPYFYFFDQQGKGFIKAALAVEEDVSVYFLSDVYAEYESEQASYNFKARTARYYVAKDYIDFTTGLKVQKSTGANITAQRGNYQINKEILKVSHQVELKEEGRELFADLLIVDFPNSAYEAKGNVILHLADNQQESLIKADNALLKESDSTLYLNDNVHIFRQEQEIKAAEITLHYARDSKGDLFLKDLKGRGEIHYISKQEQNELKSDMLNLQSLENNPAQKIMIATGNVLYKSAAKNTELRGDKFTINLEKLSSDDRFVARKLFAENNIIYKSNLEEVEADTALYEQSKDFLTLLGDVKVKRPEGVFAGDIFTYDFKTETAELNSRDKGDGVTVEINKDIEDIK